MHPRVLASPAMTRVLPGWYTRADRPASLRTIAQTAQRMLGAETVVSHETAAELLGVRLPVRMTGRGGAAVHLRAAAGPAPRTTALLVVHRRAAAASIRHQGVTMSHPIVALQEIARALSRVERVAAVDSLVANRFGTAHRIPLAEVRELAAAARGRGAEALREAVGLARERVWSPRETAMHLMLQDHGRPPPMLNHEVIDPVTGIVYYVDLAYPELRIAIEYDGVEHVTDADRVKHDHRKSAVLHAEGWTVIRVYAEDLHEPTDFFARLDHASATGPRRAPVTR